MINKGPNTTSIQLNNAEISVAMAIATNNNESPTKRATFGFIISCPLNAGISSVIQRILQAGTLSG
jgi:hypothetical protein